MAAISMATRSGSSLGKWDTSFRDDERVGRARLEESHSPHPWACAPSHNAGPAGAAAQYSKTRTSLGVAQSQMGTHRPRLRSQVQAGPVPLTLRLPQVRGSPGSSNTSVQMNVQVLCGEAGRGWGTPRHSPGPRAEERLPAAPTPYNSCRFQ